MRMILVLLEILIPISARIRPRRPLLRAQVNGVDLNRPRRILTDKGGEPGVLPIRLTRGWLGGTFFRGNPVKPLLYLMHLY